MAEDAEKAFRSRPCPICGKPSVFAFRPFCSARCKDIDLHRWLTGAYVIPGEALEEDEIANIKVEGEDD